MTASSPAGLFSPITVGALHLRNRVVMAPLTRDRARPEGDVPQALNAEYYAQRAGAGLIISEGSQVSPQGKGYAWTPGIYSREQVEGWKAVTAAVHARGGRIALQLWHVGRISHVSLQPGGAAPVGPGSVAAGARTFDGAAMVPVSAPRALETGEIAGIVAAFGQGARHAREAGFDAVEIHGANGYLIDQFLRDSTNTRRDAYGGAPENRLRLLDEVVGEVTAAIGADRTGIRLSPWSGANDVGRDSDTEALFSLAVDRLNAHGVSFLHLIEGQTGGARDAPQPALAALRARFRGTYIANNGYGRDSAIAAVESGAADMVSFGRAYIANPDLVERLARGAPLAEGNRATYYGGGAEGYTDYPALDGAAAQG